MGAMVGERHTGWVLYFVDVARVDGATICTVGNRIRQETLVCHIGPTIFDNVCNGKVRFLFQQVCVHVLAIVTDQDLKTDSRTDIRAKGSEFRVTCLTPNPQPDTQGTPYNRQPTPYTHKRLHPCTLRTCWQVDSP